MQGSGKKKEKEKEKAVDGAGPTDAAFAAFQRNYLTVYLLAMFSDWLKGPYAYVLYESYGFSKGDIALLFMGGFAASMVFGTLAGGVADTLGRRSAVLVFALSYALASLTKLWPSFWVLLAGRVASGIATSLLFSVFEAWMVCEHNARGFSPDQLSSTFGIATAGNGLVAVAAGLSATALADTYGFVAPFLAALAPLVLLAGIVLLSWPENYGDASLNVSQGLSAGLSSLLSVPGVLPLCLAQALFEGSMYVFVFMWSPALATPDTRDSLPYGFIFAVFMVCVMVGSGLFGIIRKVSLSAVPLVLHALATLCLAAVAALNTNKTIVYAAFLGFEVSCGMFFPSYGTLRSTAIPEDVRSAVMNFARVPLNAFVIANLYGIKFLDLDVHTVFYICAGAQALAGLLFAVFLVTRASPTGSSSPSPKPKTS